MCDNNKNITITETNQSDVNYNYENLIKNLMRYSFNFKNDLINYSFPRLFDHNSDPYILQPSLFPLVSPTLYFTLENESMCSVPNELKPYLRWKLTTITANTMKAIITKSGFKLLKDKRKKVYKNWSAIWSKHLKCNDFKIIEEHQKVNHFPGSFHFGRKDKLWLNLKHKAIKHGFDVFAHFHPQTFVLPQDLKQLKNYWLNSEEEELIFILKPPASARGQGISIIKNFNEIPKSSRTKTKHYVKPSLVVQRYITNPCLLYNKTKFDLRVYVLITSMNPMRVYLFDDGLVRFASHPYSSDHQNIDNQFMHLTNYSVNKNNLNYVLNDDINGQNGNKWTLKTLWRYLNNTYESVNIDNMWETIEDMIIKTVISCEYSIDLLIKQNTKSRYSTFELLGFDIMLDNNFKPWLLEVNISPSLRSDSPLDHAIKSQLIKDMFNINGYRIPPNAKNGNSYAKLICLNTNFYSSELTIEEKAKHEFFENTFNEIDRTEDIISHLTNDDIRQLVESEDELSRCGSFKRIFPSNKSRKYLNYFDHFLYYNILLDNWEQQFHNNRLEGIKRIRSILSDKQGLVDNKFESTQQFDNYSANNRLIDENFEENVLIEK